MLWISKIYFLFVLLVFIRVGFEGNNKYAKKVLSHPWNSLTLQLSLSLREKHDKIVFISAGATVFLVLRVFFVILDNPRPTLNHAICNVYSPNVSWNINTRTMLRIAVFFICGIYILLILALDSKGIINTLKRYYVAMECADLVAFTFATWEIRLCLLCK